MSRVIEKIMEGIDPLGTIEGCGCTGCSCSCGAGDIEGALTNHINEGDQCEIYAGEE